MASNYLWVKALHIAFMVTWFAGLFYLPRLFIYHTDATDDGSRAVFETMQRRLYIIMTIGAVLTTILGVVLLALNPSVMTQGWFKIKLIFLGGLVFYHFRCGHWIQRLKAGRFPKDTRWLRWFNEIPVVFLLGIICLAVAKPF